MKTLIRILLLCLLPFTAYAQGFELYVVDVGPNRGAPWQVLKYDENGENPEVFIDSELNRPQDIVFIEDRNLALVSNLGTQRITQYDATTGEYLGEFATGIGQPTRMEIRPDNLLYVLQWAGNGRVLRYDLLGNFVDEFTTFGVPNSIGMDWDSEGNLYVASWNGKFVRKFDGQGNNLGIFINEGLQGPTNIWFEGDGNLMVMDWSGGAIRRYSADGVLLNSPVRNLSEPEGVEFLENGHFLVGNGGTSAVKQYRPNGNFVKDFVPSGSGGLVKPNGLRIRDRSGFNINAGLNDVWFNALTAGQGMFVVVFPVIKKVFIAIFTYDSERPPEDVTAIFASADQRWVTAFGSYDGNQAILEAELTEGGLFNTALPTPLQTPGYGTVTLTFSDCSNLLVTYLFPGPDLQGSMELTRIADDNVALCLALNEQE
jgi:sugar lactone lactonase YvrE